MAVVLQGVIDICSLLQLEAADAIVNLLIGSDSDLVSLFHLAYSIDSSKRLLLGSFIPPRINENHPIRHCEVETLFAAPESCNLGNRYVD